MHMDGGGYDPGEASQAVLLEIRRTLRRHPAVLEAVGDPPVQFTQVRADLDPRRIGGSSESRSLTVRWYAGESPESPPQFAFHYSDESGLDCGWHHEPDPHVEGWAHYQERESDDEEYSYKPTTFESQVAVRLCWEVMDRLENRLDSR